MRHLRREVLKSIQVMTLWRNPNVFLWFCKTEEETHIYRKMLQSDTAGYTMYSSFLCVFSLSAMIVKCYTFLTFFCTSRKHSKLIGHEIQHLIWLPLFELKSFQWHILLQNNLLENEFHESCSIIRDKYRLANSRFRCGDDRNCTD